MSFDDIIRGAIATAQKITNDGELQETVSLKRWRSQDSSGAPTYATTLPLDAIVDHSARRIRMDNGNEILSTATVTFLQPIPALSPAVTDREEPIDKRDLIVLASGKSGPILKTNAGLTDPTTARGYVVQVFMG